jgi:hypothetical protein
MPLAPVPQPIVRLLPFKELPPVPQVHGPLLNLEIPNLNPGMSFSDSEENAVAADTHNVSSRRSTLPYGDHDEHETTEFSVKPSSGVGRHTSNARALNRDMNVSRTSWHKGVILGRNSVFGVFRL